MDLRKLLLTENACYKAGRSMIPGGIMWHSTGANNPNLCRYVNPDDGKLGQNKNNTHWNTAKPGGRNVCVHAFIGKDKDGNIATYQTLPWTMQGWHAGKNAGNNKYIGFEICEDALTDKAYFDKVYREAVELTAYLCQLYKLDPMGENVIICHADGYKLGIASNHADIYHWFNKYNKTMDDVRRDVKALMEKSSDTPTEWYYVRTSLEDAKSLADKNPGYKVFDSSGKCVYPEEATSYRVKITASELNVRGGSGTEYKVVTTVKKGEIYTIVAESNGWGKLKSGAGWIKLSYTARV